VNLKLKYLI